MEAGAAASPLGRTRRPADRAGDVVLLVFTALACLIGALIIFGIVWKVISGAWPAVDRYGLGFLTSSAWDPIHEQFGAWQFILGTMITAFGAVLIAAPISIAIGLFLSELVPAAIRGPVGTLIDMLAAVPSVVVGLWGIFVLSPFCANHVEPFLHNTLGWIPVIGNLFGSSYAERSVFTAILVLAIMIVPITSAVCRELFIAVPRDLEEGALALGATRWEMIRGVVLQYTRGGIVAAIVLGLGRALGEAIAVTQVIGNFTPLKVSLFQPGDALASKLANVYPGDTDITRASLTYLALILLAITLTTNIIGQRIVHRFRAQRAG